MNKIQKLRAKLPKNENKFASSWKLQRNLALLRI